MNLSYGQINSKNRVKIDSLKYIITFTKNDSIRIEAYVEWDNLIYISNPALDYELNTEIIKICKKNLSKNITPDQSHFFIEEIAYSYNNIATYEEQTGNNYSAIEHLKLSAKIGEYLNKPGIIANAYNNMGNNYRAIGLYEKSIELYQKSLFYIRQSENPLNEATTYNNIGLVYVDKNQPDTAMSYYMKALNMFREIDAAEGLSLIYFNIGLIYKNNDQLDSARYFYETAYNYATEIGDKNRMSSCLNKLGEINLISHSFEKKYLEESLVLFNQSVELATKGQGILEQIEALENNYKTLKNLGRYEEAYFNLEKFHELKSISDSLSNMQAIIEQDFKQSFQNKIALDSIQYEQQSLFNHQKLETEKKQKYFLLTGLLLLILLALSLYYKFKDSRKKNEIIHSQKKLVEDKQQEILDSIQYAKRIQNAILPPKEFLDGLGIIYHLTYIPKDIVAGDFFWVHENEELLFIAVADCTGHGVPGALVSIVCHNCLNRSVKEFSLKNPAKILDKTRELVTSEFSKSPENVKDGMDISLLAFDRKKHIIEWAGANNPLWIISKNSHELNEIKPDKQPIGFSVNTSPFKSHRIEMHKGDRFFIFTDGLQDQFGRDQSEDKPKKFKASRMKKLLLDANNKDIKSQCQTLTDEVIKWKNDQPQTDDICFFALEF